MIFIFFLSCSHNLYTFILYTITIPQRWYKSFFILTPGRRLSGNPLQKIPLIRKHCRVPLTAMFSIERKVSEGGCMITRRRFIISGRNTKKANGEAGFSEKECRRNEARYDAIRKLLYDYNRKLERSRRNRNER